MFKVKYERNGKFYDYNFVFKTEWGANVIARELRDAMRVEVLVVEVGTNLVLAHYWAD